MVSLPKGSQWSGSQSVTSTSASRLQSTPNNKEAQSLTAFLCASSRRSFVWGSFDCAQWLRLWIEQRRRLNVPPDWLGSYRTPLGAARILKRSGGFVAHMDAHLSVLGIGRAAEPARGDIAIVDAPEGQTGGIVAGRFVACLAQDGIAMRQLPILAAWSI